MHSDKCKEPDSKGEALYESNYMAAWKSQNYSNRQQISGCQGLGVGC